MSSFNNRFLWASHACNTRAVNLSQECYSRVKSLLTSRKAELKKVAETLAEKEELSYDDLRALLENKD